MCAHMCNDDRYVFSLSCFSWIPVSVVIAIAKLLCLTPLCQELWQKKFSTHLKSVLYNTKFFPSLLKFFPYMPARTK